MSWRTRYPGALGWVGATSIGAIAIVVTSVGPLARITWVSPIALFWIVTIAASLCVLASAWVLRVAHRDDRAEVGFLGSSLLVLSVLPLVHGITAPGVLYGGNSAVVAAVYVLFPFAIKAWQLMLLSFTLGLGLGAAQPMVMALVHRIVPEGRAGEALGLRTMLMNSSQVALPLVFGAVSATLGMTPVFWSVAMCLGAGGYYTRKR